MLNQMLSLLSPGSLAKSLLVLTLLASTGCQHTRLFQPAGARTAATKRTAVEESAHKPVVPPALAETPEDSTRVPMGTPVHLPPPVVAESVAAPTAIAPSPGSFSPPITQAPAFPEEKPSVQQKQGTASSDWQPASCLPVDAEWKKTLEAQTASMQQRLESLEQELTATRTTLGQMNETLATSQAHIVKLNQELSRWQGETRRLEGDMLRQQQSDLKSLDELTSALNGLLQKQRSTQTGATQVGAIPAEASPSGVTQ
ncbi:hypothetical protein [Planctomicrobium sp. SH527]|uniref:hypothetical protein n=1 Tax=Planctomicrobium sp. SH527 TaxID=3448123 RepID=UPI003F5CB701